jgi:hypothetical protein
MNTMTYQWAPRWQRSDHVMEHRLDARAAASPANTDWYPVQTATSGWGHTARSGSARSADAGEILDLQGLGQKQVAKRQLLDADFRRTLRGCRD